MAFAYDVLRSLNVSPWADPAVVQRFIELWKSSIQLNEIAPTLKKEFDINVTRNAVIGKADRMGLPARVGAVSGNAARAAAKRARHARASVAPAFLKPRGSPRRVRKAPAIIALEHYEASQAARLVYNGGAATFQMRGLLSYKTPAIDLEIPVEQRKQLVDLERKHCHWPVGEVGHKDFFFCGGDAVDGSPYCQHHHGRAYYKPTR